MWLRQPSESITLSGSTRPRTIPCNVAFEQVRDDLGINLAIVFEDAKDAGLAISSTPTLAFDAARAEEAFINLDDTEHRSQFFAGGEDAFAQAAINAVEHVAVHTRHFCGL